MVVIITNKKAPMLVTTCIKRCNAEMLELYEKFTNFNVIKLHLHKNEVHFIIEKNNGTVLKFLLSNKYPFQEPKLLINNNYYNRNILQNPSSAKINSLLKKYKINCMCCSSIICDKNWSPAYRIENVLDEIEQVNIVKRYVKQFLIMDEICIMKNIHTDTIGMYILDFVSDNPFIGGYLFCKTDY